jgi:hypothetical protein
MFPHLIDRNADIAKAYLRGTKQEALALMTGLTRSSAQRVCGIVISRALGGTPRDARKSLVGPMQLADAIDRIDRWAAKERARG